MDLTVYGHPTNAEATLVVTADTACVPAALLGPAGEPWGVLAEVLSGGVYYTVDSVNATPDQNDFVLTVGDQLFLKPANRLRMRRTSTDSCVKLQAFA